MAALIHTLCGILVVAAEGIGIAVCIVIAAVVMTFLFILIGALIFFFLALVPYLITCWFVGE